MFFWQLPSVYSQWAPSAFVIYDSSYSCAEQYMMTEEALLFHDHRALELIPCSSDYQSPKRVDRNVRGFDHAIWKCVRETSVLAEVFAKFSQSRR